MKNYTCSFYIFTVLLLFVTQTKAQNFVTTWETTADSETITIPTTGMGYLYDVDWENDGTFDDIGLTGDATHTFPTAGVQTIAIRGDFPRIFFNNDIFEHIAILQSLIRKICITQKYQKMKFLYSALVRRINNERLGRR